MIYLYTTYFISKNPARQNELDYCIINNVNNKKFDKIIVFIKASDKDFLLNLIKDKTDTKNHLVFITIDNIPTYKQWIESIIEVDHIAVFANADIYFDDSINKIYEYFTETNVNTFLCISRYETSGQQVLLHQHPWWSQDVWAIRQKDKKNISFIADTNIATGTYRCDSKIAYKFAINGWSLYNPCYYIKCYHKHESNIRSYDTGYKAPIIGALVFVYPCILNIVSSIEYMLINKNNTNNILGCSLNNYLLEHIDNDCQKK
jgi:hypothetical protein